MAAVDQQPREGALAERFAERAGERLLNLPSVLDELVRGGFIGQREAEDILIAPRTAKQVRMPRIGNTPAKFSFSWIDCLN